MTFKAAGNSELQARRERAVPRGVACLLPVFAERAHGTLLHDVEGREYIDFAGGIAVLNVGHTHAAVRSAVEQQLQRLTHTCFQVTPYEPYVALAERLNAMAPTGRENKTLFLTTGAEAVENAIKIARYATGRPAVIAFSGAFHGRTAMGMALTGKTVPYKSGFGPLPAEIYHVAFPTSYRGPDVAQSLAALDALFKVDVEPSRVAAIIIEPVQGEGGFHVAPPEFLKALRRLCDQHGIVFIADEIQTGFARTGTMFAIEQSQVAPDLITTAKSLAGGLPLSAVNGAREIMDSVAPGGLGGTYAGNPLSCAAALAVLDVIEREKLAERAQVIGKRLRAALDPLCADDELDCVGEVRGLGAMIAVELVTSRASREPATQLAKDVVQECARRGLIVLTCGMYGNVIRFLAPLVTTDAQLQEGIARFKAALAAVRRDAKR